MQNPDRYIYKIILTGEVIIYEKAQTYFFSIIKFNIFSVWKEIALNQTNNRKDFRVWDYPIKEEFGQILAAIERTGTVPNRSVGYQMVSGDRC